MIKLSSRELILTCATLAVVVVALSFWLGEPKCKEWKRLSAEKSDLINQIENDRITCTRKDRFDTQLAELRTQLQHFESKRRVIPELLKGVRTIAANNRLKLVRIQPGKEKQTGDLHELRITCQWTGTLETLTRTLHELQRAGARYDVSKMHITPQSGGQLKGSMEITCAYYRNNESTPE